MFGHGTVGAVAQVVNVLVINVIMDTFNVLKTRS
jgi:hypothetical protein